MNELTPRQRDILELIRRYVSETGYPPTRSEIARQLGFRSPNAAEQHLRALERKGAIEIRRGASRGIRLLDDDIAEEEEGLPVVGRVAAGSPILAEAHIERRCALTAELFSPRPDYLLAVRGMSMQNAGILDGDLLAVHRTVEAKDGQIVVARLHDEVTVKRFERRGPLVRLLPENDAFQPIEVDLRREPLDIEGIGVGVIRSGL